MRVVVLNGSPKGARSVTRQSVAYLARRLPQVSFEVVDVGQRVGALAADPAKLEEVAALLRTADGVLWATPVYYLLVPSQLKRFIELLCERYPTILAGRQVAALTTSIHFYDQLAHSYLRGISEDLGGTFAGSCSAEMGDLLLPAERVRLEAFALDFVAAIGTNRPAARATAPLPARGAGYQPGTPPPPVPTAARVLVLSDALPDDASLTAMGHHVAAALTGAELVNLRDLAIRGGCQGCCRCGFDNECQWADQDGYRAFYEDTVRTADVIVFAARITDRNLSWVWRQFFDRSFYHGHAPSLAGKVFGFMLAGPLRQLPDLRTGLQAWTELQEAALVDFVSDEDAAAPGAVDAQLEAFAGRLAQVAAGGYRAPDTFLSVAGRKLFRDKIWGELRVVFQADHAHYRRAGKYDFPQRSLKTRLLNAVLLPLTRLGRVRRLFRRHLVEGMVAPYERLVRATPTGSR